MFVISQLAFLGVQPREPEHVGGLQVPAPGVHPPVEQVPPTVRVVQPACLHEVLRLPAPDPSFNRNAKVCSVTTTVSLSSPRSSRTRGSPFGSKDALARSVVTFAGASS